MSCPKLRRVLLVLVILLVGVGCASTPHKGPAERPPGDVALHLYFVRHAETVANATKQYNDKTERTFTEVGEQQRRRLVNKLADYQFDAILVSPLWRAQHTILPYLQANELTAELWPELAECCWQDDHDAKPSKTMREGPPIINQDLARFRLRDAQTTHLWNIRHNYGNGMQQVREAARLIQARFSRSGGTILVVGHSLSGSRLIRILSGSDPEQELNLLNTGLGFLRERHDGTFEIVSLNR
jgi:broad specificity phosphatase PhoE